MSAIANIIVLDGQDTPVSHTFAPARAVGDVAMYEDRAVGSYVGFNKLTLSMVRPTGPSQSANRNIKLGLKLETPKMQPENPIVLGFPPAPTVAYRPTIELVMTAPERSAKIDRKDLRVMLMDLLDDPAVIDFFENYSIPY